MNGPTMIDSGKPIDESRSPAGWWLDRNLVFAITHSACSTDCRHTASKGTPYAAVPPDAISAPHLAQLSGVSELDIGAMVDYGVLAPMSSGPEPWQFASRYVPILRRAQRLREDFAFDEDEFALALILIFEFELVEKELQGEQAVRRLGMGGASGEHLDLE